jgi:superfamily I DNA/RNA helicase
MPNYSTIFESLKHYVASKIANFIPTFVADLEGESYSEGYGRGHNKGYEKGHADGHKTGYDAGYEEGYKKGDSDGHEDGYGTGYGTGYDDGYEKGLEDGKTIWEIVDKRALATTPAIENSIYGPRKFRVTEKDKAAMRKDVVAAVAIKLVSPPTNSQWDMIFSDHPATCVVAGAGSGKSTTLILRVIFMLKYLQIDEHEMTIVTFTRAACAELRESLIKVSSHWDIPEIDERKSKRLVRTFHSVLYKMATRTLSGIRFFENYPEKVENKDKDKDEDDIDNPMSSIDLNSDQMALLKNAYCSLYAISPEFKKHVLAMLKIESRKSSSVPDKPNEYKNILDKASARDLALVREINKRWKEKGIWPDGLLSEEPVAAFKVNGHIFYANAISVDSGDLIFLGALYGANSLISKEEKLECSDFTIGGALSVKSHILAAWCNKSYQYINSHFILDRFNLRALHSDVVKNPEGHEPPIFGFKLEGEFSNALIYEALFTQAGFIENMGMEVPSAIAKLEPLRMETLEYHFSACLGMFWPYFEGHLRSKNLITYNRAFLSLAENPPSQALCTPVRHLLIDEFQDISPQIVAWIKACQHQIISESRSDVDVSIMAIGDDWQSIYGWRGSAPEFFMNFGKHFPVHSKLNNEPKLCKMEENFRSIDPIVRQAQYLLQAVDVKTPKKSISMVDQAVESHGVMLEPDLDLDSDNKMTIETILEKITSQLAYANSLPKPYKNRVIVMCRKNKLIEKIEREFKKIFPKNSGVVFYTYHRSKGLQGEVAIMVEDTHYDQVHVFRNQVYAVTGLFDEGYTYDVAMADEAKRLAYVGVTRGKQRVFWFVEEKKGSAKEMHEALSLV